MFLKSIAENIQDTRLRKYYTKKQDKASQSAKKMWQVSQA